MKRKIIIDYVFVGTNRKDIIMIVIGERFPYDRY